MSYKDLITTHIKDQVNKWLNNLKQEHPKLGLTRQWRVHYENGFTPGVVSIPVITGTKKGKHLIAEVTFQIPQSLELDLNDLELTLKNEPFKVKKKKQTIKPISEPLGILNEMIIGVNNFLSSIHVQDFPSSTPSFTPAFKQTAGSNNIRVNPMEPVVSRQSDDMEEIKRRITTHPDLPEWVKTLTNYEVRNGLIEKIAAGYISYKSKGNTVSIADFFRMFEDYLKRQGKLNNWCRYKSKNVDLDESTGFCLENYCSKKPYRSVCPQSTLQFG